MPKNYNMKNMYENTNYDSNKNMENQFKTVPNTAQNYMENQFKTTPNTAQNYMENQFKLIRNNQINSNLIQEQDSIQINNDNVLGFDNSMPKFDNTDMTETSENIPRSSMTRNIESITNMQMTDLDNVPGFDNSMSQFDDTNMSETQNSIPSFYINEAEKSDTENSLVINTNSLPTFEIQDNVEINDDTMEPFMNMLGGMSSTDTRKYFNYSDLDKDNRFVNDSMLNNFNKRLVKKQKIKLYIIIKKKLMDIIVIHIIC